MIYLIEPYNAHQKPPRKKHWTEIAEEEALLVKTQLEHQRLEEAHRKATSEDMVRQIMDLREAQVKSSLNNQNIALPQYAPQPAAQQVQDGQYAAPAGGGGWVIPTAAEADEVADFQPVPQSGVGPLLVSFVNLMPTPENDTFLWEFGSGSLTSTLVTPANVTYTQTGSYTITLHATSSTGAKSRATKTVTVTTPTVIAALTGVPTTGAAPLTVQFTGSAVYNGAGSLTYRWEFGSGSATSTTQNPSFTYNTPGSYTVSLQVTESSYNVANKGTRANYIVAS